VTFSASTSTTFPRQAERSNSGKAENTQPIPGLPLTEMLSDGKKCFLDKVTKHLFLTPFFGRGLEDFFIFLCAVRKKSCCKEKNLAARLDSLNVF